MVAYKDSPLFRQVLRAHYFQLGIEKPYQALNDFIQQRRFLFFHLKTFLKRQKMPAWFILAGIFMGEDVT